MICENAFISGNVVIGNGTIVQPTARIECSEGRQSMTIGERNIFEEKSSLVDSTVGHGNLIETKVQIRNAQVGSFCVFHPKCEIINSTIGDKCIIGAAIRLEGVTIPTSTVAYNLNGKTLMRSAEMDTQYPVVDAYYKTISDRNSDNYIGKHNKFKT